MSKNCNPQGYKCWTCAETVATHKVFREALDEYEYTCDECYREEYPELETDDEDVVKWSAYQFGGDKCGFCNQPNEGRWIEGDEDAVCEKCSQVWEYDDDTDSYRQLQPSRRA